MKKNIRLKLIRKDGFIKSILVPEMRDIYVIAEYNNMLNLRLTHNQELDAILDNMHNRYFQWTGRLRENKKSITYEMKEQ